MAMRGGPRLQVGSAAWIAEERDSALNIARSEIEEFSFSARNEMDWLNEHMAEIFSENQMNVAELFKTPGRLRGKTPRTLRKPNPGSVRVPLSNVFSATLKGASNVLSSPTLARPRTPQFQVAEDKPEPPVSRPASPPKPAVVLPPQPVEPRAPTSLADSGYHGSQSTDTVPLDHFDKFDKDIEMSDSPQRGVEAAGSEFSMPSAPAELPSPSAVSAKGTFQSTKDSQMPQAPASATSNVAPTPSSAIQQPSSPFAARTRLPVISPRSPSPRKMGSPAVHSPQKPSPQKSFPQKLPSSSPQKGFPKPTENFKDTSDGHGDEAGVDDDVRSPSDASSPIRPIVRKSSLNFASLPAREPLGSKKSLGGARMSRTSHLDFSRQSYYNRHTGGKSLGHATRPDPADEDDDDEMDVDDELVLEKDATEHTKTYTQRLQDQINMLGKAQPTSHRPSKSIANLLPSQQSASTAQSQSQMDSNLDIKKLASPKPKSKQSVAAPGAFPSDNDDDWIAPPAKAVASSSPQTRPSKEHSEKAEGLAGKETAESREFVFPKGRLGSPGKASSSPSRTAGTPSHTKSASVPSFPTIDQLSSDPDDVALKKTISVSNPALSTVAEDDFASPPRSPTRTFRDNPLKQVKNKLSSLLKSSKGLIASSAAISAEGKSSLLQSPSTSRLGYHPGPSVESFTTADNVVYPDLSQQISATSAPLSPTRSNSTRRTRASAERERREAKERDKEDKEKEKELKEAKRMAEQMDKLEKLREQEREKARVFSKEQEKIAAMERQVTVQKEQEKTAQAQSQPQAHDFRTPGPQPKRPPRSPPKTTGTTPGKTKGQAEEDGKTTAALSDELDFEMQDAASTIAPPSIPRPTTASSVRTQGKRPVKPTKEASVKAKQAPTVIRVNTTSSQHSQFHPSNSVLAATLQETLGQQPNASQKQVNSKASQASLHTKPSLQSLKSSVSSASRPKALEVAAKRKEQEEREAQRKRDAKRELERKRAAQEEERRAERQREEERKAAQAKKAAIEKAKQTKAPPPAVRSQPNGPPDYSIADKGLVRPPSRLGSTMHQDGRLVNTVLSNNGKRPLQHDPHEESSRSQQQRALPSFPSKEGKRMRMSEEFDEDIDMVDSQRIIKPPVRPSGGFKKDLPAKSMYGNGNGYVNPPPSAGRDLFKATVTAQHNSQAKAGHPLDMAQLSKGAIPFAPNPNAAGPSHKTPGRPVGGTMPKSAKSVARPSPRFQNGESIELPDIQTDDESDDGDAHIRVASWAESPALKEAILAQERVDPMQVFGPPAPLNMEEVFNKSKDRWHKFRARTSSANWSGTDRLTEEDIKKDLQARDKMRRQGGWSYELSREMS
ncbi:Inner centromere protein-related protein pic1 [Madurella mycetomatis]|uniref:Inner centromere protein-related protein pic1 n=1 Tax=Madurella mycetomatis TaxID=100816 RepID=A0A175W4C6_9PEZI|nr:Inner centromere protein-related protein pic1 [Madurella mycetomatis]